jgi:hypothetical protein
MYLCDLACNRSIMCWPKVDVNIACDIAEYFMTK